MSVNTPASWSPQDLSAHPGIPSGTVTFRGLTFKKAALTSAMVTSDTGSAETSRVEGILSLTSCSKQT